MVQLLPLTAQWRISAESLPDRLLSRTDSAGFSLPGAQALSGFTDLLGSTDDAPARTAAPGAPFSLPAMIPDDVPGRVTLSREIDFGALGGDRALLLIDSLAGSGSILIGNTPVATFGSTGCLFPPAQAAALTGMPCALAIALSDALHLGRRETLSICFDEARPAGVPGSVTLSVTQDAYLSHLTLSPDAAQRTLTVRTQIAAQRSGAYALRVQTAPGGAARPAEPAREVTLTLGEGEIRRAELTLALPGGCFSPGTAYAPATVKILLLRLPDPGSILHDGSLCDSAALLCGYPGPPPAVYAPLSEAELRQPLPLLAPRILSLHLPGVLLSAPAGDGFYRAMTRAGVGVIQQLPAGSPLRGRLQRYPCVTMTDAACPESAPVSLAASAWQLCGMTGFARAVDPGLDERDLLAEAAGFAVEPQAGHVQDVLVWLRAVLLRLRAEAARQRRYAGPLCAPGELLRPDAAEAIGTALAPLHLSALPLCGAWWTGARFCASLEAFIPAGACADGPVFALALLEDEDGRELARVHAPCRAQGGYIGVIEAVLPQSPCVLTLTTRLLCGGEALEESVLPVYVGERGPLEAAFSA